MLQVAVIPSALLRTLGNERGGAYMAVAAAIVAASPGAMFDATAIEAWTGWSPTTVRAVERMLRQRGWLDDKGHLCGPPADMLLARHAANDVDAFFVKACQYITDKRGTRYRPTENRRRLFAGAAAKYGAEYVYEVVRHRVDVFMRMRVGDKSMAQYACLETILRPSNFEKYKDEYEDSIKK